jgi:hypothetical protein
MQRRDTRRDGQVVMTRLVDGANATCEPWEIADVLERWITTSAGLSDEQRAYLIEKAGDLTVDLLRGKDTRGLENAFGVIIVTKEH